MRAIQFVSRSIFFAAEDNVYRYWWSKAKGQLKIQIRAKDLKTFRQSEAGRQVERYVDIFEVGGGWYCVQSKDCSEMDRLFGTHTDGLKMWIKALNAGHVARINANHYRAAVVYTNRVLPVPPMQERVQAQPHQLAALVNKFSHQYAH
jgi:hypothetical protein